MGKHGTAIEWTHVPGFKGETWNPIVGCSVVSAGCTNCYAMGVANRLASMKIDHYANLVAQTKAGPVWNGDINVAPRKTFLRPWFWKKPRAVFVNSMGDLFHEAIEDAVIDMVFAIMALCPQHTFMVLTKRADRMREFLCTPGRKQEIGKAVLDISDLIAFEVGSHKARPSMDHFSSCFAGDGPFPNIWLGVSVEDQKRADERICLLLDTPAVRRFISCEPLLGSVDLTDVDYSPISGGKPGREAGRDSYNALSGGMAGAQYHGFASVDWVIAGGESGASSRPMHPAWARSLRDQCAAAEVPFFFKQWVSGCLSAR